MRVNRLRFNSMLLWAGLVVVQCALFPSIENIIAAAAAMLGGVFGICYGLQRERLRATPISSAMVLGFTVYYFLLPPMATLIEGKPLTHNLDNSGQVFLHALVGLAATICAHVLYSNWTIWRDVRFVVSEKIYRPVGYFVAPGALQLHLMGAIGLSAMAVQVFVYGVAQSDVQGAGNKFAQALFPLAYLPFCTLVPALINNARGASRSALIALGSYSLLLVTVATARNSRAAVLIAVMSVVLCYVYGLAAGLIPRKILKLRRILPVLLVGVLAAGVLADLATSMVIVRERRADTPPIQLLEETIVVFTDKAAIRDRRLTDQERIGGTDERYVDNVFLARLANLKFTDTSLGMAVLLDGSGAQALKEIEFQRALIVLPRPVLGAVFPEVDKDFIGGSSGGDFMAYVAANSTWLLGGYRTGSLLGSMYGIWGWLYPLVLLLILLPTFALADAQTSRARLADGSLRPVFAPLAVVLFFSWFYYLTSAATGVESFGELMHLLVRGWLECLLIYSIAFWGTRAVSSAVSREPADLTV